MTDLATAFTTIYLVIPPERMDTQRTWLRLVLTAAMQTFKRGMPEDKRCSRDMFLIDEFPALGRMKDIPRDIATMSGYGLDFTLIIQGLDQLEAIYGDASGTILNNCSYKWFCNVSDLKTAKYVSETLGQTTVGTVGKSVSAGKIPEALQKGRAPVTGRPASHFCAPKKSSPSAKRQQ